MAFISAKNFVAPFTSTFHLVTIFLIALIFMILRWSGFGTSVSDYPQAPIRPVSVRSAPNPIGVGPIGVGPSGVAVTDLVRPPAQTSSGAAIIDEVRRAGEPDSNTVSEPARPNSFDDIQRKLGLK